MSVSRVATHTTPSGSHEIAYPLSPEDPELQDGLEEIVETLGLADLAAEGRLGIALVDLSTTGQLRTAMINGDQMFYAASLPKIAILLGTFDAIEGGQVEDTAELRQQMTEMIRVSNNAAATTVLDTVGFGHVAETLQSAPYRLYEPAMGGGLWVGKAYAQKRYWQLDPIAELAHSATPRQAARFFVLLERGKLVSEAASAEMMEMLGDPGINSKFVRGLQTRPGAHIYRKSGSWKNYHADAALIVRPEGRYVAVGLVDDARGETILQRLIVCLDDLIYEYR